MLTRRFQQGVSLIELIVGIVMLSVLMAIGIPMFGQWIQNTQVRTAAESILDGLQLARNEAVRRNANVRFNLTSTTGLPEWTVCVVSGDGCGEVVQERSSEEGGGNARVGISTATPPTPVPSTQYSTALAAGAGLSGEDGAGVTFNGVGAIPVANIGTDITRIDITNAVADDVRRLVVVLGTGGLIRMCDPQLALANNPQGCS
jgi:type IV fimbrial biogenesis protein FimT